MSQWDEDFEYEAHNAMKAKEKVSAGEHKKENMNVVTY